MKIPHIIWLLAIMVTASVIADFITWNYVQKKGAK